MCCAELGNEITCETSCSQHQYSAAPLSERGHSASQLKKLRAFNTYQLQHMLEAFLQAAYGSLCFLLLRNRDRHSIAADNDVTVCGPSSVFLSCPSGPNINVVGNASGRL